MTKWLAMLVACLALGLVAAGCGGDDDNGDEGSADTTEQTGGDGATTEEKAAEGGGKTVQVVMKDIAFDPTSVTVKTGGTVEWTNEDSVGHDVTKTGGPGPEFSSGDSGGLKQGDTYKETFNTAGKIDYVCTVHPNMTASVTVK